MSESRPLIFERISLVMADIDAISKDRTNTAQKFNYRGVDEVYNELHPLLAKHQVFTVSDILHVESIERKTNSGGIMMQRLMTIRYRFYTIDGSYVDCVVIGEAMDSGDKTSNKCMAVGHKYALLQVFCIPTKDAKGEDKDPDGQSPGQDLSPDAASKDPGPVIKPKGSFKSYQPDIIAPVKPINPVQSVLPEKSQVFCLVCLQEVILHPSKQGYECPNWSVTTGKNHLRFKASELKMHQEKKDETSGV